MALQANLSAAAVPIRADSFVLPDAIAEKSRSMRRFLPMRQEFPRFGPFSGRIGTENKVQSVFSAIAARRYDREGL